MGWNSRQKEKWTHFFHTKQNKSFLIWKGTKKKKPNNKTHTNPHNQNTTHTSFCFFFTLLSPTHNKFSIWKLNSHQLQHNPFLSQQGKKNWFCFFFLFLDSGIESYWTFVLCFASVLDSKSWWWWCDGGCLLVMVLMVVLGWELEVSMLSNIGKLLLLRLL